MKKCTYCEKAKPASKFRKEPKHADGLTSWCRECTNLVGRLRKTGKYKPKKYSVINRKRFCEANKLMRCSQCKQLKPYEAFNKRSGHPLGLQAYCKECESKSKLKYRIQLSKEVFDYYGRKCVCCGELEMLFLTIDHTNNDGNTHLSKSGYYMKGERLYTWLRKNNYPAGFQTLCFNCNCGKARNKGICPHEA